MHTGKLATALVLTLAAAVPQDVQSLDGSGNNQANPTWGKTGTPYARIAAPRYADGSGAPVTGPNARLISNRIFNDTNQNIFSERRVSQWGFTWGQFLDHTFGLRDGAGETADIPFDSHDPLESFTNTLGHIPFARSKGVGSPRQQINTVSSYLDAFAVYGGTQDRLSWLRDGAKLLMPGGYLPRRDSRGDPASAPPMDVDGRLRAQPNRAAVAGDVRANESLALTATHTLFAREHNRIVSLLPGSLTQEQKFQIARRVVIAEQQYITYNEFLPSLGVRLPPYFGYRPNVNASLGNEFATVGYRAHSMIHGEVEVKTEAARYSSAQLDAFRAQGIEVEPDGDEVELTIPLNVGFFNPDLVPSVQLGPLLKGIGAESEYKNDEQIDNQLRSVLFQIPVSGNPDCLDGPTLPQCFKGVLDLGAVDIERGRDHGMPSYNQLRSALGLSTRSSFAAVTGEGTETFPSDPLLTPGNEINDPNSLDFVRLFDINGKEVALTDPNANNVATRGVRRTPLAARLKAVFGGVDQLDAFTGMLSESHRPGTEFGELQLALWQKQFQDLRDGDRFFYGNDPGLSTILRQYGIDYRRTLAQVIAANTDIPLSQLNPNVFFAPGTPAPSCKVAYSVDSQVGGVFAGSVVITNTGSTPIDGWTLEWNYANGQRIFLLWDGIATQGAANVPVTNEYYNRVIPAGRSASFGFLATSSGSVNAPPTAFTLNNQPCALTS
ncbi:peroxidase family protein [Nonomuraea sediminis]|uniref:peroxidase family protein n=1 Tax=Nonomuraea sediminis TaxID=2835864 RepID=UPI001BDC0060|nr:peroxidase family protein [Nonomuraea sediminis]